MDPRPPMHKCNVCDRAHYSKEGVAQLNKHFMTCLECEKPVYYEFVVNKEIWEEANLEYHDGVIHLPCLEARLGRELGLRDFIGPVGPKSRGQSINDAIRWAYLKGRNAGRQ